MEFLVTAAKGLEEVVAGELRDLNLKVVATSPGGVRFVAGPPGAWKAALCLRAARRVLQPLATFSVERAEDLYEGTRALPWADLFPPSLTFAVEASVKDSPVRHSGFAALKVKDAVADSFRDRVGRRPDVDRRDPAVRILVRLGARACDLSLDLTGPLHKRGYRLRSAQVPLNETLAAGMLLLMGYDGSEPLADPFCGSGTLLVEAALVATRTAPGLLRATPFPFERLQGFDGQAWEEIRAEAAAGRRRAPETISGSDFNSGAVRATMANAHAAGVSEAVTARRADALAAEPPCRLGGLLVTNPPYGEKAGEGADLPGLYRAFGDRLKHRWTGWRAGFLTPHAKPELVKAVGLRPRRRLPLWNGPMECRLIVYELYEGTRRGGGTGAAPPR